MFMHRGKLVDILQAGDGCGYGDGDNSRQITDISGHINVILITKEKADE